jgi:hypothetical protein
MAKISERHGEFSSECMVANIFAIGILMIVRRFVFPRPSPSLDELRLGPFGTPRCRHARLFDHAARQRK